MKGARGKRLGDFVASSFGGVSTRLRDRRGATLLAPRLVKVDQTILDSGAARNLVCLMRKLFGMGTPRGLQKEATLPRLCIFVNCLLWCVRRV